MHAYVPSQTAERVALARAIESLLPQQHSICSDPYAHYFLEGLMKSIFQAWLLRVGFCLVSDFCFPGVMAAVLLRTRFMDDYLGRQIALGAEQVVNLGAGYDTRALRFQSGLQTVAFFEVDHPATQARKTATLKRMLGRLPANLVFVPVHFNHDNLMDRLAAAGYRPEKRTVFIWEGVTYYISPEAVDQTFALVSRFSGPGSVITFDFVPPAVIDGTSGFTEARSMHALFRYFGEELTFGVAPDRLAAFLAARGFTEIRIFSSSQLKETYLTGNPRRLIVSDIFSVACATSRRIPEGSPW